MIKIGKLSWIEDLENFVVTSIDIIPVKIFFNEINDENYVDITSVTNFEKYYLGVACDYKRYIYELKEYLNTININELSDNEKKILCKYCLLDKNIILNYYTEQEYINFMINCNLNLRKSRERRFMMARSIIEINLSKENAIDLAFSIASLGLDIAYLNYGIEGYEIDNVPGIFDFVEGNPPFNENGFPTKPYYNENLKNKIMNILIYGNENGPIC